MKFIHVRLWDGDYLYPNGGYTYAYNIVGDKVQVAKAACSLKDNYCKRVGRAVAGVD